MRAQPSHRRGSQSYSRRGVWGRVEEFPYVPMPLGALPGRVRSRSCRNRPMRGQAPLASRACHARCVKRHQELTPALTHPNCYRVTRHEPHVTCDLLDWPAGAPERDEASEHVNTQGVDRRRRRSIPAGFQRPSGARSLMSSRRSPGTTASTASACYPSRPRRRRNAVPALSTDQPCGMPWEHSGRSLTASAPNA